MIQLVLQLFNVGDGMGGIQVEIILIVELKPGYIYRGFILFYHINVNCCAIILVGHV